jgi:hypothetical protein
VTVGTGIWWVDWPLFLVGCFYLGKALGYLTLGVVAFVRYRRDDARRSDVQH